MKKKIYTKSHDLELLKEVDNDGGQFTADEHAYVIENDQADMFKTKENLLRYNLPQSLDKLAALGFLFEAIEKEKHLNILSLGAGTCMLEYLLKLSLPEETRVIACDFDGYLIEKAKSFFPEITAAKFDFFTDDIETLLAQLGVRIDIAVFFGSAYVMDDEQFVKLFDGLRKAGAKEVVDFHAGYMGLKDKVKTLLLPISQNRVLRKMFGKKPLDAYPGKFHGYSRDRSELLKLYRKSGFVVRKEIVAGGYEYVAVMEPHPSRS